MKNKLKKLTRIKRKSEKTETGANRITTENLAEHREEVLGKARKYIYPLRHSKHRLVVISLTLLISFVVIFFSYSILALYKFKTTSEFMYQVTKVIPFPLARIGSDFVSYESYLFEVKHYMYYYQNQQNLDFNSDSGRQQLAEFKKRAHEKVINDAYVKKIAAEKRISVSEKEVDREISVYKNQNRLGSSEDEFKAVLKEFWDWSVDDFRRSLKQQLLSEKVIAALDTEAKDKADKALSQLRSGKDFAELAREVSEDPQTKQNGGDLGLEIDKNNLDIPPKTVEQLFKMKPGEYSEPINIGYALQIVKNNEQKDDKVKGSHILFNFKDLNHYLREAKDQRKTRTYVSF